MEDIITGYSRAEAISDGILIDVSKTAKEAGFRYPVAMTSAVWHRYVEVPRGVTGQDESGRLWDVLWMLRIAIRKGAGTTALRFQVLVRNDNNLTKQVTLKSICGPGDDFEPVITVMLPEED